MLSNGWGFCGFHCPSEGLGFPRKQKNEELGKALTETPSKITCNFSFDGVSWCEGFSSFFSLNITDISESLYTYSQFFFPSLIFILSSVFFFLLVAHSFFHFSLCSSHCLFLICCFTSQFFYSSKLPCLELFQSVLAKVSSLSRPNYALDLMLRSHPISDVPSLKGTVLQKGWRREDSREARRSVPWEVP